MAVEASNYLSAVRSVPGWLYANDVALFVDISDHQRERDRTGDLLEIGAFLGKSAILLGYLLGPGERLVVCDLFETSTTSPEGTREKNRWYPGLARRGFEENYGRFHDRLPEIVAGPSTDLDRLGPDGSFRFIHVDGGHSYDVVRHDLSTATRLLSPEGVVVIDDWRSVHTPGVVAATWEAIVTSALVPFCFTEQKLYATLTANHAPSADAVEGWVAGRAELRTERYEVMDRDLVWVGLASPGQPRRRSGLRGRLRALWGQALRREPAEASPRPRPRTDRR